MNNLGSGISLRFDHPLPEAGKQGLSLWRGTYKVQTVPLVVCPGVQCQVSSSPDSNRQPGQRPGGYSPTGRQITIPSALIRYLKVEDGDILAHFPGGEQVIIKPHTGSFLDLCSIVPVDRVQDFDIIRKLAQAVISTNRRFVGE